MIEIKNLNAWLKKTQAAKARIKSKATDHVQSQVLKVFKVILKESPQYSGDFVSNWEIVTNINGASGYVEYRYKDKLEKAALDLGVNSDEYLSMIRQAGHPEAISYALRNGMETIETIKWNTKISIRNSAPISDDIATGFLNPAYRPVHAHLEGQSFVTYIKQKHGMGWIG
jgi:hypothetical protein